jgi:hypothetical protein
VAKSIPRATASACRNPVLDYWAFWPSSGAVADAYSLEFQVFDIHDDTALLAPVQVYPATEGDRAAVSIAIDCPAVGAGRLGVGHYVAGWTPDVTEALGRHRIVWFVKETSTSEELEYQYDFDVLPAGLVAPSPMYALLSDLRDEGVAATSLSDIRAVRLLHESSQQIERWTRRIFEPRWMTMTLDGTKGPTLGVKYPIIALAEARIDGVLMEADQYTVFNRHITEGLTDPDDRYDPRIRFSRLQRTAGFVDIRGRAIESRATWWPGARNAALEGLFGYTDFSASYPAGVTPQLLRKAVLLLTIRNMTRLGDASTAFEVQNAYRVKDMRTRDQSISFGPGRAETAGSGSNTEFTGDPEIDDIIALFTPPPTIRAV